jgi:hypothetical protein
VSENDQEMQDTADSEITREDPQNGETDLAEETFHAEQGQDDMDRLW